jgi:hypothetical protein
MFKSKAIDDHFQIFHKVLMNDVLPAWDFLMRSGRTWRTISSGPKPGQRTTKPGANGDSLFFCV